MMVPPPPPRRASLDEKWISPPNNSMRSRMAPRPKALSAARSLRFMSNPLPSSSILIHTDPGSLGSVLDFLGARRSGVDVYASATKLFLAPGAIGVLLQGPVYLLGHAGTIDTGTAVGIIGVLRLGLGWPLRIAAWGTMVWLLARNATVTLRERTPAA